MHSVDPTTESMIRSVLAYAENRLRLNPVPLDEGSRTPAKLDAALNGLLGAEPHNPDQVLGVYTSVVAPAVISADSPRFLGFIPAAPTKASLLFDMLVSCASIQGISWLEAAGAIHAENLVLRLIADLAGVAAVAREHGLWFHVDGAYGGAGLFAPSIRHRYDGIEHADSFIVDPHKWLFAPFDCAALLYRDPSLARETATEIRARDNLELIREPELGVVLFRRRGWDPGQYTR
jgi:Pyridoxal-dependent decarboxylase conserved domain